MQLIYKIEFNSTNLYFKKIIEDLIKEHNINGICKQYKGFILIILEDSADNIESFFALLEKKLPVSIFIGNSYVVETYDETLEEIKDFDIKQNLSLLTNDAIKNIIEENHIDFLNDIVKITKGEISRFETHNGLKDLFLPNKEIREEFESKGYEVKLLITDTSKLEELFDINVKDFQLLCSIERPLVKLKFKILKNVNKEYSSTNFIYAKIPDDKETVLFAQALKQNGVNFVLYVNDEVYQDGLKITYTKEQNLIIHGDKGLFPKYDFVANKKFNSSKDYFDENGGVYKAILAQESKRIVTSLGVYFSQNSTNSSISINIPTKGLKQIISIPNIYNSIENCFEEIADIDEHCARLIVNYSKKFPNVLEGDVPSDTNGFESIINMCAKVLGINSSKEFEDMALNTNLTSGIQIDMKLIDLNGVNYLDYRRIVQSIMAYKMADVDNVTLIYSFYESLSEFICNYVNEIAKETKIKDVVLCGNMFANSILLSKTTKTLSKNYNIILPKEYPLDY
uniref:Kae1-like domain-containing protein n=1 Tax=Aliarcobacter sp. TaxID=2321116 RepID=UPI004048304A